MQDSKSRPRILSLVIGTPDDDCPICRAERRVAKLPTEDDLDRAAQLYGAADAEVVIVNPVDLP
jgi:hypothetical protein